MDKVEKYRQIICQLLEEYISIEKTITPHVKPQMLIDTEHDHYQSLAIGWHNGRFIYQITFHFDIINEKVWVQQNNTDILIADELVERGIPKSDIVIGFVPEQFRHYEGFATA